MQRAGVNVLLAVIRHDLPTLPRPEGLLDAEGDLLGLGGEGGAAQETLGTRARAPAAILSHVVN